MMIDAGKRPKSSRLFYEALFGGRPSKSGGVR
jgi:hypothetical protein